MGTDTGGIALDYMVDNNLAADGTQKAGLAPFMPYAQMARANNRFGNMNLVTPVTGAGMQAPAMGRSVVRGVVNPPPSTTGTTPPNPSSTGTGGLVTGSSYGLHQDNWLEPDVSKLPQVKEYEPNTMRPITALDKKIGAGAIAGAIAATSVFMPPAAAVFPAFTAGMVGTLGDEIIPDGMTIGKVDDNRWLDKLANKSVD